MISETVPNLENQVHFIKTVTYFFETRRSFSMRTHNKQMESMLFISGRSFDGPNL